MTVDRRTFLTGAGALSGMAAASRSDAQNSGSKRAGRRKGFRRIATEEAFATPEQVEAMTALAHSSWDALDFVLWRSLTDSRSPSPLRDRLLDVDNERIQVMDELGVSMQVLSLTAPGVQMFDADTATHIASAANDRLAEIIKRHPGRYAGLAAFAPQDPKRATFEMERAITRLKLNGFIVNSHTNGEYLDQPKYWPILEAAEALDAPIYIHPRCPPDSMAAPFRDYRLESSTWGFHSETGLHGARILVSGVLDRFPKLKIVLGHMGEGIPYWLWRIDYTYNAFRRTGQRMQLTPSEAFKRNFVITTSGVNSHSVLKYVIEVLGIDNVMWAIDYPYQAAPGSVEFMNTAPVSDEDREKLFHRNAERVFRIAAADA
jgi:5-carboxyvanillate decarboxylase